MEVQYPIQAFSFQFEGLPPKKAGGFTILPGELTIWEGLIFPALQLALLHGFYDGDEYRILHQGWACGGCTFTLHVQTQNSPQKLEVRVSLVPIAGTKEKFNTFLEVLCYGLLSWDTQTKHKVEIRLTPGHEGFVPVQEGVNTLIELTR